jgi:hypothetical protein
MNEGIQNYNHVIEQIKSSFDSKRVNQAIRILETDAFLFSQVRPEQITGIVPSQTDREIIWVCSINNDGKFACCSQHFNLCGGMKGALCKHLLALIMNLTKSDAISPVQGLELLLASKNHSPKLNRDLMRSIFQQYERTKTVPKS